MLSAWERRCTNTHLGHTLRPERGAHVLTFEFTSHDPFYLLSDPTAK